jgi:hypothetical protein
VNGRKWKQEKQWMCLDISPVFSHVVSKLVQAHVTTYNETFQTLAVKGDVLLLKPFPDLGFEDVSRWKSRASERFFQFPKHMEVRGWDWWCPKLASGTGPLLLLPGFGKSHRPL